MIINFWFINYPLCSFSHLLDEIRTNLSDTLYSMYYAFMMVLMFEQLNTTCVARMHSSCGHVSVFPRVFWPFVLHFSLLFPFFCVFPYSILRSTVCFCELPFSILRFLASHSCSFFFFDSSMVDYSAVRVDCPSIAFFFAHLGGLLQFVEGECLEGISSFIGKDCSLCSFFLVSFSFPFC